MRIEMIDLAGVVYSAGKVFDNLSSTRLATEDFLRSGETSGLTSRADLALLEDLRDVAQLVVDSAGRAVDGTFTRGINAAIVRSGALHPGQLRTQAQGVGVRTRYGAHQPPAMSEEELDDVVAGVVSSRDPREAAARLFVELARALPFEDGNKRTALFAANAHLISAGAGVLLAVPFEDDKPEISARFSDLLARAYVFGEDAPVLEMLHGRAFVPLPAATPSVLRIADEGPWVTPPGGADMSL